MQEQSEAFGPRFRQEVRQCNIGQPTLGPTGRETAFKAVPRERARAEASPRPAEGAIDVDCGRPGPTSGAAVSEGTVGDVRADWGS
jgi:hypothetical protein